MKDRFMVSISCPRCGEELVVHRARLHNWIHRCRKCKEHFMIGMEVSV